MKLKPCPWCGREVSMIYDGEKKTFRVGHPAEDCGIRAEVKAKTLADAKDKWNRRK